ncbi:MULTISPECIES: GAF domain-containing protein [Mycobacterium]|uniref:GAF domain-containing protein n=1 Tax=Mycobacterium kiyosense TaxID=2871094 RepID=A0A9P3QBQ0_9MYCO|nr:MULTISPECIES: GAF domain-containing protein [Mycobacterium]BDB41189.1 hypothetical protein IWGMT90018_16350 [Mycobacterium kiyosense]BDE12980.1 hypothetical protein MKCMC460_18400 [Mycobacterium sp. 20KCMC460]GLB85573.1 hypothetical protein SRL2020028_48290 [Mycobacterium kiyosense]GLB92351.1 hypothetical protein SRL2020130_51680 [Mycobacterium kiyosense]GLB98410.1 hypothetical protein SRL2020226_51860 [Mycobacterium kiyosense]
MTDVYRAPLRSRSDDVDPGLTIERARRLGLCGFGRLLRDPAESGRLERRVARFAEVENGSFVWTRDPDGLFWLGRIAGPYFYDDVDTASAADLVHVRPCDWLSEPLLEPEVPDAVVATFGRGGRNFQRIHHPSVSQETQRIWDDQRRRRSR